MGNTLQRLVWLLWLTMGLAACSPATTPLVQSPTPTTTSSTSTPTVWQASATELPTKNLVICAPGEPQNLLWTNNELSARTILDAVREPLIDHRSYEYQANLVERLPSFDNGDANLRDVLIGEGNIFFDLLSQRPMVLSRDMTQPFALYQRNGEPLIVQQWDGSDLQTVQTVVHWTLLDGLRWQDGTPVTAYDSLYAFSLTLDKGYTPDDPRTGRTNTYTALNDRTIEWSGIPGYVDSTYFLNLWDPLPRHIYEDKSASALLISTDVKRRPYSYGPFMVSEWNRGTSLTLVRNPYYVRGQTSITSIRFEFNSNPEDIIENLLSGACDIATQNPNFEKVYTRNESLAQDGRLSMQETAGSVFEHLDFNTQPAPGYGGAAASLRDNTGGLLFQNPKFRQAIALCLKREDLVAQNANGAAFVRYSYIPQTHLLYPGDNAITVYPFNPMQARSYLAQLGWQDTNDDLILDNGAGQNLEFHYSLRRDVKRVELAEEIREQLKVQCGIDVGLTYYGSEFFDDGPTGVIFGRKYDVAEFAWENALEPPCYLYLSSQIPNDVNGWGAYNNVGFANAAFDAACTRALSTLDENTKAAAHAEALQIFTAELPSLPLFARTNTVLYRPEVKGVILDPTASSELWNVENFDVE